MAVKVKIDHKELDNLIPKIRREFIKNSEADLERLIVDESISLGISPVQGEGKFQKYSPSYKEAIKAGRYSGKNISPVNMKLSGDMLNSFFVKKKSNGIIIGFKDELAEIHTLKGAGKSKVIRKLLPLGSGEDFKTSIKKQIIALLEEAVATILGKR